MTEQDIPATVVVDHIDQTIAAIAQLRANHHGHASAVQRGMDGLTTYVARPRFLAVVSAVVAVWIGLNLLAPAFGRPAIDPPPFAWLGGAVGLAAFYMVVLILATQKREDQLAQHRELLIMELAIVSEQKIAKVIQLLEESRRDNPMIQNRVDAEADTMAQPSDTETVLVAIAEAHEAQTT
jgi:uncharacterized membrane protein